MRILHIQSWPGFNNIGGTEIYIKRLVERQSHEGHTCFLLLPGDNRKTKADNLVVYESDFFEVNGNIEFELGIQKPIKFDAFQNFIKELKPDEVYFHCFWMKSFVYLNYISSLNIRIKIVPHLANFSCIKGDLLFEQKQLCDGVYGSKKCFKCSINKPLLPNPVKSAMFYLSPNKISNWNKGTPILKLVEKKLILQKFCSVLDEVKIDKNIEILCLTRWYYKLLEKNKFQNLQLFQIDEIDRPMLRRPTPKKSLKLLFVGRLTKEKGIDTLINAINKFDDLKIRLIIAGPFDGDYYKSEILSNQRIDYLGVKNQKEILDLMKNVDLLIIPSFKIEMKPLVLLDAIKQNLFPIGADLGGIRELIIEFGGDLFTPGNSEELHSVISGYLM